jgi:hypothetical protein
MTYDKVMSIRLPSFRSTQGFDHRVWTLFYGRIISSLGYSIVMPFLSIYPARRRTCP